MLKVVPLKSNNKFDNGKFACLSAFLSYTFHNKLIVTKFLYVAALYIKNSHRDIHAIFYRHASKVWTRYHLLFFFKTSQIIMKFWYAFKVRMITLYILKMIIVSYVAFTEIHQKSEYINQLVFPYKVFRSTAKFRYLRNLRRLYIRILLCGPVDKLWIIFIPYSVGYMFLSMVKILANFILFSAI